MSIETTDISITFGAQRALDRVSISVKRGQVTGFLGPNGAGKSSLMKILTTNIIPDSGHAVVNGYDVLTQKDEVRKCIGYLPEHNPIYTDMYVREYLGFSAGIYKVSQKRIEEVIGITGLESEAHKIINELSKGYRQRVGIASAILHNPEVLILDEPTTGLDPNQLIEIRTLIKDLGRDKTILLSTHIIQEAQAICDSVIIINKGKIVAQEEFGVMNSRNQQTITVEFDYRVEPQLLREIPNLVTINSQDMSYTLIFEGSEDMRGAIFDFSQAHSLKILSMSRQNRSLEKLFSELTS